MRHSAVVLVALLLVRSAAAQRPVVPDTLDWRAYYPLAIGNVWEWSTWEFVNYHELKRVEITGDTTVGQTRYFIQKEWVRQGDDPNNLPRPSRRVSLVRYDSAGHVMMRPLDGGAEVDLTCNLSAPFGGYAGCKRPLYSMRVGGFDFGPGNGRTLVVGNDTVRYRAVKYIHNLGGGIQYFHGVGRLPSIGDGLTGIVAFVYLRLGGRAYGQSRMPTALAHEPAPPEDRLRAYPNPARTQITVSGWTRGNTAVVYDPIGRRVASSVCAGDPCTMDVRLLPRGAYFLRMEGSARRRSLVFLVE